MMYDGYDRTTCRLPKAFVEHEKGWMVQFILQNYVEMTRLSPPEHGTGKILKQMERVCSPGEGKDLDMIPLRSKEFY
jgi:hypothetical protein